MKIVIKIIILFMIPVMVLSQNISEQKYKLATSYENNGEFEESLRIFKEIYDTDRSSEKYFAGVVRSLRGLSRYSDMLPYIEERVEKYPNAVIFILAGEIYWRVGNTDKANDIWDKVAEDYASPENFLKLSQVQINLQLYNKAIRTLKKGRENFADLELFSDELSKLYIATGNYREGLDEIINMLMKDGDLAKSQGRLFAFMTSDEAVDYLDNRLDEYSSQFNDNIYIQELYSWFLRNSDRLDKALEVTIKIDELRKSQGRSIVYFANNARDDGQFDIALKAYSYIIDLGNTTKYISTAMYGFTRTLELKLIAKEDFSKEALHEIIDSYQKIIKEFPNSQYSAQAYLRLAMINYNYLNDNAKAIKYIEILKEENRSFDILFEAMNILGDIYLARNEFEKAQETFRVVAIKSSKNSEKDYAKFSIANIQFYKGNIDSALTLYNTIVENTNSDVANDALERIILINENKDLINGLKLFGDSELNILNHDYENAVKNLKEIVSKYPDDDLTQRAYVKIGEIEFNNKKFNEAIVILEEFINKFSESIRKDYAYFLLGKSYLNLEKNEKAQEYFTKILVEFPRSIYLQESRQRIRQIRKES